MIRRPDRHVVRQHGEGVPSLRRYQIGGWRVGLLRAKSEIVGFQHNANRDIAGDGAFSLGMIAEYMDSLVAYAVRLTGWMAATEPQSLDCRRARPRSRSRSSWGMLVSNFLRTLDFRGDKRRTPAAF